MDGFDAAPVELQVCGSTLGQIGEDLRTEMDVLQREMDALLSGGWRGQAANGFTRGHGKGKITIGDLGCAA